MSMSREEMEAAYDRLAPGAARWASRYSSRLAPRLQMGDDYAQEARIAVWMAVVGYDPGRGAQLSTYAHMKARSAVADARRKWDPRPRYLQEAARAHFDAGATVPGGWELPLSLDDLVGTAEDRVRFADTMQAEEEDPHEQVERRGYDEYLWRLVTALPPRERALLFQYYVEGKSLKEIGMLLGCSQSRASQIHTRALGRLRKLLAE
jgi:RNA polymerase sigma factor (sigma-70 family)